MTVEPVTDVAAIERAYVEGKATVAQILVRFAISKTRLYRLIDEGGWPRRIRRAPSARDMKGARIALVQRLYRRFERHLEEADKRRVALGLKEPDEVAERDARTMSVLARTLEKVMELDEEAARPGAGQGAAKGAARGAAGPMDEADAERMRAELARRIARITGSGRAQPLPGRPQPR